MPKLLKITNVNEVKNKITDFFSVNEDARFVRRLDGSVAKNKMKP